MILNLMNLNLIERCLKCRMNIHIDCVREAEKLKISMICFGTPDPRSKHGMFPEHGVTYLYRDIKYHYILDWKF